jgi:hypothetical protein
MPESIGSDTEDTMPYVFGNRVNVIEPAVFVGIDKRLNVALIEAIVLLKHNRISVIEANPDFARAIVVHGDIHDHATQGDHNKMIQRDGVFGRACDCRGTRDDRCGRDENNRCFGHDFEQARCVPR